MYFRFVITNQYTQKMPQPSPQDSEPTKIVNILGWKLSAAERKKLITWTIEGLIISVITFAILWLPLIIK